MNTSFDSDSGCSSLSDDDSISEYSNEWEPEVIDQLYDSFSTADCKSTNNLIHSFASLTTDESPVHNTSQNESSGKSSLSVNLENDDSPCFCHSGFSVDSFTCHKTRDVWDACVSNGMFSNITIKDERNLYMIQAHGLVSKSGLHNFEGVRIPVNSKMVIPLWRSLLANYTDKIIVDFLQFGFPVGYSSESSPVASSKNHSKAYGFPKFVDEFIETEMKHHAIIGPFDENPLDIGLITSPINTTEKKGSPGKRRIIMDLSFPHGKSVNAGIDKDVYLNEPIELHFPSVDNLIEQIHCVGPGALMFKRDLQRAYRQLPIDPGDIHLLGFCWKDNYYIDTAAPFGLRSSAMMCQRVTDAIRYIMSCAGHKIINYLDDLAGAGDLSECSASFNLLGTLLKNLGLDESVEKAVAPTTCMTFLGCEIDSVSYTISVPPDKLVDIKCVLRSWLTREKASLRQVQSLIGKLQSITRCVRVSRVFLSRLLRFLRSITHAKPHQMHSLTTSFHKDILWWHQFVDQFNGMSLLPSLKWSQPDSVITSDACLSGCGALIWTDQGCEYFHTEFPSFIMGLELCVNALELLSVIVAVKLWCNKVCHSCLVLNCDNQVSVQVINSGRTRIPFLESCLRELSFFCARSDIDIRGHHVAGVENRLADHLSRWHLSDFHRSEFQRACPSAVEIHVSQDLFRFYCDW